MACESTMNSLRDLTVAWRCRAQCPLLAIARLPDGRTWHSLVGPGESTTHTTGNEWTMVTTERGMCVSNEQKIRPMKTWPRLSWTVSSHIQQKIHIARKNILCAPAASSHCLISGRTVFPRFYSDPLHPSKQRDRLCKCNVL